MKTLNLTQLKGHCLVCDKTWIVTYRALGLGAEFYEIDFNIAVSKHIMSHGRLGLDIPTRCYEYNIGSLNETEN